MEQERADLRQGNRGKEGDGGVSSSECCLLCEPVPFSSTASSFPASSVHWSDFIYWTWLIKMQDCKNSWRDKLFPFHLEVSLQPTGFRNSNPSAIQKENFCRSCTFLPVHQEAWESPPEPPVLFPISIFIIIIIIILQLHSYQAAFSTSVQQDSKGLCGIHLKICSQLVKYFFLKLLLPVLRILPCRTVKWCCMTE